MCLNTITLRFGVNPPSFPAGTCADILRAPAPRSVPNPHPNVGRAAVVAAVAY